MANKKPALVRPAALGRYLNFAAGAATALCNRMLEADGLTLPQWVVLSALWRADQMTVGELADYSGNNIPATSRIVDRMIDKDLVKRVTDKTDRRAVRISLTAKAEALRHLSTFHEEVNTALLKNITAEDAALLMRLLDQVEGNARSHPGRTVQC